MPTNGCCIFLLSALCLRVPVRGAGSQVMATLEEKVSGKVQALQEDARPSFTFFAAGPAGSRRPAERGPGHARLGEGAGP